MRLSVIIPTHNRPESLRSCLETLQRQQEVSADQVDVLVIDDGSDSDPSALVADVAAGGLIPMRCQRQELAGLNSARNAGAALTKGDVLAFLDDDTLVSAGWAAALLKVFQHHPCAGVGGRVELGLAVPAPPWLAPRRYYLAEYDLGQVACWLEGDPVPVGANCAVRRSEFERVGGFHPGLDRIGTSLVSNGDTEFFRRLRAAGGRLRYEPGARVIHCVPADRLTIDFFVRRHFAQGVSDELLLQLTDHLSPQRERARLARELIRALGPMGNTVGRDLLRGRGTVNARFFTSYWRGRISALGKTPQPNVQFLSPRSSDTTSTSRGPS